MSNLTSCTDKVCTGNVTLLLDPTLCTLETCSLSLTHFNYLATIPGNAFFAGLFGVMLLLQLFFGIKHKTWGYMGAMTLGLLLEVIGYVARVMMHTNPFNDNGFLMYLICLTIAPALLTASIYLCLARIINVYGEHLSYFRPRTYTIIFCTCDFICLVLQGAGGGVASTANTRSGVNVGKNMMLAGLIFQVISLAGFTLCAGEFALRVWKGKGMWNNRHLDIVKSWLFKGFLFGLGLSTLTIFIRSVYRCAELSAGFDSSLFRDDELLFMLLEGTAIVIACLCLTFFHPGVCFQGVWDEVNFKLRSGGGRGKGSDDEETAGESMVTLGEGVATTVRYETLRK